MIKRSHNLFIIIFLLTWSGSINAGELIYYNVKDYGAKGNGIEYDTEAIQSAIDNAAESYGGVIYFPPGRYLTKTIVLKDNITLKIDNGSTILGSTEMTEFKPEYGSFKDSGGRKFGASVIFAKDVSNISIMGDGTIDGQGFEKYYPNDQGISRPSIIRIIDCKNVKVQDVFLTNSAAWVQHYINCEDLYIRGIRVRSYSNKNNDGLDIEGCSRVTITDCNIDCEDDSIVLKTLTKSPCKDVVINNCVIGGLKSAIKTGTESIGGFENITISNCTIYGTRGISLLCVDGGYINNITISNISMRDTYAVIVLRLGERMRPYSVPKKELPINPGYFRNVTISNIQAQDVTQNFDFISGIPGHYIENVSLNSIRISYKTDGKTKYKDKKVPEKIDGYPKAGMFGSLPSYGFYFRHVKKIRLRHVQLRYENLESRPPIILNDIIGAELSGIYCEVNPDIDSFFDIYNCRDISINECRTDGKCKSFLKVSGSQNDSIFLYNNFYKVTGHKFILGENVSKEVINEM